MLRHGLLAVLPLLAAPAPAVAAQAASRPNVLLVLVDDLGWSDLGCYGNRAIDTPRIDAFAADAVRFTDAYAAAPVCSPTRAAIMTGLAPARLRITNHLPDRAAFVPDDPVLLPAECRDRLALEHVTLAEHLQAAGYRTAFMGKWHLAPDGGPDDAGWFPDRQGFELNLGGNGWGGPGRSFFAPYSFPNLTSRAQGEYLPERLGEEAVAYLHAHAAAGGDAPFFLALWHYTVHWPMDAPAGLVAKYEARAPAPGVRDPRYAGMVEALDGVFGRVLDALDETGLADDTLVVFTSDNGALASVADLRPLRGAKGDLYEGGLRVPLLVRWPGHARRGAVEAAPVISTDLFPTLLAAAGVALPADFPGDGVDLAPALAGDGALARDALHFHYPNYAFHRSNRLGGAIRAGRFKLVERFDDGSVELFDLAEDIGEARDLAGERPALAALLRSELAAWRAEVDAAMPRRVRPAAAARGAETAPSPAVRPPSVVVVLADDLGYGDLGCYDPASRIPTPTLDRLAREGLRFSDAHSPSAVCSPTRYALLTGRYAWRTWLGPGVMGGYTPPLIEPDRPTLPGVLQGAGYRTAFCGKWHLGVGWTRRNGLVGTWRNARELYRGSWQDGDPAQGLDVDFGVPIQGGPLALGFERAFFTAACPTIDGPFCFLDGDRPTALPTETMPVDERRHPDFRPRPGRMAPGFDLTRVDLEFTDRAIAFLEDVAADPERPPFFLELALSSPHAPWLPPDEVLGTTAEGPRGDLVALVDREVGRLDAALTRLGLADDTLLLFTSDNGPRHGGYEHRSAGPLRGHKSHAWEGGHRVPLLARWPGRVPAGATTDAAVELTDLFATVAALAGATLPEGAAPDSFDVGAVLLDPAAASPRPAVLSQSVYGAFTIRVGRWKLIHETEGSGGWVAPRGEAPRAGAPGQLYDLAADSGEARNLFAERPDVVARLTTRLAEARAAQGLRAP